MKMQTILSNGRHSEYGDITVSFPIPEQEYDHVLALLQPMEIGDAVQRDCKLDELMMEDPAEQCQ